jgi:hypothetical protein
LLLRRSFGVPWRSAQWRSYSEAFLSASPSERALFTQMVSVGLSMLKISALKIVI